MGNLVDKDILIKFGIFTLEEWDKDWVDKNDVIECVNLFIDKLNDRPRKTKSSPKK